MAAQRKTGKSSGGGRGSKEAVEKRRAARQLNAVLSGGGNSGNQLDGRTEKRRQRLIQELKEGRSGKPLKPIDYVSHVDELLSIGETLSSLRKQGVKRRRTEQTQDTMEAIRWTQKTYDFHPEAWRMLGIAPEDVAPGKASKGGRGSSRKKQTARTQARSTGKKKASRAPSKRKRSGNHRPRSR